MSKILICFALFAGYLSKAALALKLVDVSLECRPDNEIIGKYLIASKTGLTHTKVQVHTCKPTYNNYYCRNGRDDWNPQVCRIHKEQNYFHIKCNVRSPFKGPDNNLKTYALKISIKDEIRHKLIEKVRNVNGFI